MTPRTPVLVKLAELYEQSAAGRRGGGKLDFQPDYETLLRAAGCQEGEKRELAERELLAARDAGILSLVPIHRREPGTFGKVRLAPENEAAFFAYIHRPAPATIRVKWSALFREAADSDVPQRFEAAWRTFCLHRTQAALSWSAMKPFTRDDLAGGRELLGLLTRMLAWDGRHLVRWVSSVLCGDSKYLERRQRTLESLLVEATGGEAVRFEDLGILPVPPGVTFHGPLRLRIGTEWRDFRDLHGPTTLSGADVDRVTELECHARRCVTVENATPFRALAALQSGELLIHTSYPNEATLGLLNHLKALPTPPEFWHFGDTDPSGFHILADLRNRSGIPVRALQMNFRSSDSAPPLRQRERALLEDLIERMPSEQDALRAMLAAGNKGNFEQENLGPPTQPTWPFY